MSRADDLSELEAIAGAMLAQLSPSQRRRLLGKMARELQSSQSKRIQRQLDPDGSAFAPRKKRSRPEPQNKPVRFLYRKKASAKAREVIMKSYQRQGRLITGYDAAAEGLRTFNRDRVVKWLPSDTTSVDSARSKIEARTGRVRRQAMFRKLRRTAMLKAGANDSALWVGFSGRVARIAGVHQRGGLDSPGKGAPKVRYAKRELIGFTFADRETLLDALMIHFEG